MAFAFIPVTVAAFIGVAPHQAGLASGLLNTSQQIGGALGVAITATIFTSHSASLVADGESPAAAATSGFHWAFMALAIFAAAGALAALTLPSARPPEHAGEEVPVYARSTSSPRRREAVEDAADLPEQRPATKSSSARAFSSPPTVDRVVARIADQLLRHLPGLLVGRVEAARLVPLLGDLVVEEA